DSRAVARVLDHLWAPRVLRPRWSDEPRRRSRRQRNRADRPRHHRRALAGGTTTGGHDMSGVRVLVGTRKGAFVLTADGARKDWTVEGPHFPGWELYHLKGSPADPNRIWASQNTGWFGQLVQRSDDGGKTWNPVGKDFVYDGVPGTHQWYD